jgi:hypothetical protein
MFAIERNLIRSVLSAALLAACLIAAPARAQDREQHDGFSGFWLRGKSVEAFVAVEPKFRVLSIRRTGQPSLVGDSKTAEQGLRLAFMESQQVKQSFDVGNQPAEIVKRSDVSATLRLAPADGLRYTVTITADADEPRFVMDYELTNIGTAPRQVACWSVIAFERNGLVVAPFGSEPRARRRIVLSWWTQWPQPSVKFGRDSLAADAGGPLAGNAMKVGLITSAGWIAFTRGDEALVTHAAVDADAKYPEDGANVIYFAFAGERKWCEIERVGPLTTIAPGESARLSETIVLVPLKPAGNAEPDAQRTRVEDAMPKRFSATQPAVPPTPAAATTAPR